MIVLTLFTQVVGDAIELSRQPLRIAGTTGVPKAVDVKHRNVTNRERLFCFRNCSFSNPLFYEVVCIAPGNLGMGPGARVSQLMNISFDMAAWVLLSFFLFKRSPHACSTSLGNSR